MENQEGRPQAEIQDMPSAQRARDKMVAYIESTMNGPRVGGTIKIEFSQSRVTEKPNAMVKTIIFQRNNPVGPISAILYTETDGGQTRYYSYIPYYNEGQRFHQVKETSNEDKACSAYMQCRKNYTDDLRLLETEELEKNITACREKLSALKMEKGTGIKKALSMLRENRGMLNGRISDQEKYLAYLLRLQKLASAKQLPL